MGAANAESVIIPACNKTENLGSFAAEGTACLSGYELGVISHNSGCVDDEVSIADILGSLSEKDGDAHISDSLEGIGLIVI